jgi:hypothetical protein
MYSFAASKSLKCADFGVLHWSEGRDVRSRQLVDEAPGQRVFRSYEGKVDLQILRLLHDSLDVWLDDVRCRPGPRYRQVEVVPERSGAAVPRRDVQVRHTRRLPQLPGDRVLSSSTANQKHVHLRNLTGCFNSTAACLSPPSIVTNWAPASSATAKYCMS